MHFYFSDFIISPYLISFISAFVITFTVSWILLRRKEIPRSFIIYNFVLNFVFAETPNPNVWEEAEKENEYL